jgi:hypothetical protein
MSSIVVAGDTSGSITIQAPAVAGSGTVLTLPTTTGTLYSTTSGGAIPVSSGGTSSTSLTANNVLLGNGTSALQTVAPGTSGNVLTSNGTTWTSATPSGGGVTSAVAGNGVAVSGATGAVTFSAACPNFNTVGSYSQASYGLGSGSVSNGTNYGGASTYYLISGELYNQALSGTWKAMGVDTNNMTLICRVS